MAAVTSLGNAWNTTTGSHTITATPAVGDMIIIVCGNSGIVTTPTVSDNNTDTLGVYTNITGAASVKNTSADSAFIFMRNSRVGSATSTVFTITGASSTGGGGVVLKVTSTTRTGLPLIRQSTFQSNVASGTPAPAFTFTPAPANPIITYVFNGSNTAGTTVRSSPAYTSRADLGYNVPATGLDVATIDSGETSATITWGGTSPSAFSSGAIEVDISTLTALEPYFPVQQPSNHYRHDWHMV